MKFKYLILHCTATPEGRFITAQNVKDWHTKPKPYGNGWHQVGYSDLILLDGSRHQFVKHDQDTEIDAFEITNGVAGINSISRHLCYVGGMDKSFKNPKDTRTDVQLETMIDIIEEVLDYAPDVLIAGHNQFDNKACPSFWTPNFLREIGVEEKNIEKRDPFGYEKYYRK
jgi:N-acetylmuramoyl-L-alanine amidase